MKILRVVGSARKPSRSGVHRLVSTVLENTGVDCELVHLAGKHFSGCIACLGCVKDNVCKVGIPVMMFGEGVEITEDMVSDVAQQPEAMQAAADAGRLLGGRLRGGHDRRRVSAAIQKMMMAMMVHSA